MPKVKRHYSLPDADHVMRYVPRKLQELDDDGNVVGFYPGAFAHRDGEEYLSVNWLEYYEQTHASNVTACKAGLQTVLKGAKSMFGVGQVGRVKELSQYNGKPVRIVHYPNSNSNPSHSAIFTDIPVHDTVCESLALEFYKEHY